MLPFFRRTLSQRFGKKSLRGRVLESTRSTPTKEEGPEEEEEMNPDELPENIDGEMWDECDDEEEEE